MKNSWVRVSAFLGTLAASAGLFTACGEQPYKTIDMPPVKQHTESLVSSTKPSAQGTGYTQSITVTMTLDKARILGREFMYSLDLQYSSQFDSGFNLYNQSLAVVNVPVIFRKMGNELQLVTDNKLKFPSDNNHPEDVISRMPIISETDATLTVGGMNSAPYLSSQMESINEGAKSTRHVDHWIRSFDFDPNGNYILQQTSLKMADKTIAEFMESLFPRENLASGPLFKKFEMDPEDPVGAKDGPVSRYRYIPGDSIVKHDHQGEQKLAYVSHYDISPRASSEKFATIDWYVTPNIPDEYLAPVKQAVEGWNRYFLKMDGIHAPILRFLGRLPEGIHIGDPRYNVINWDSRLIAGAAYASQLSDPESGKQSHSVIYMPAAWLRIGIKYWNKGIASDEEALPTTSAPAPGASAKARLKFQRGVRCDRDVRDGVNLLFSGRLIEEEAKKFGIQLLKQTLFHEVGHTLGLNHNFEGSTSYDPAKEGSMFSTSIMDYNDYELERAAFDDVDSANGPLLEYDRQAMSALYNSGKDVSSTDAMLPACNDAEADDEAGGVNPICTRYDLQADPTQSIGTAISRIENEKVDSRDVSLSQALSRLPDLILTENRLKKVESQDDLMKLTQTYSKALKGALDFYITSDVSALMRTVRTNIKSLYVYGGDLPDGYDAAAMRERVFAGVRKAVEFKELPAAPQQALTSAIQQGIEKLMQTAVSRLGDSAARAKISSSIEKSITSDVMKYFDDTDEGVPAARAKVLASLVRHPAVDYYLGTSDKAGGPGAEKATVDYEKNVVALLSDVVIAKERTSIERIAAATSLKSFATRLSGQTAISSIKAKLQEERVLVTSSEQRRALETILQLLSLN